VILVASSGAWAWLVSRGSRPAQPQTEPVANGWASPSQHPL